MQPPVTSSQFSAQPLARADADYGRVNYETFCQAERAFAPPGGFPRWASLPDTLKEGWTAGALAARAVK
jgi:hypothetical protein